MYELWLVEMDGSLRSFVYASDVLYSIFEVAERLQLHPATYTIKVV
jgi:hypothetical protein